MIHHRLHKNIIRNSGKLCTIPDVYLGKYISFYSVRRKIEILVEGSGNTLKILPRLKIYDL